MSDADEGLHNARENHAAEQSQAEQFYKVLQQQPQNAATLAHFGMLANQAGHLAPAEELLRRSVALDPLRAATHCALGIVLLRKGNLTEAAYSFRRALQIDANNVVAIKAIATIDAMQGRKLEAIVGFRRVLALCPDDQEVLTNLGIMLTDTGARTEAAELLRRAVGLKEDFAPAHNALAAALYDGENPSPNAEAHLRRAIELAPHWAMPRSNLANLLNRTGRFTESLQQHRAALACDPNSATAHANFGVAAILAGNLHEGIAAFRRAVEIDPTLATARQSLLLSLNYDPDANPNDVFAEHLKWETIHTKPLAAEIRPLEIDRNPNRRLRIGYVCRNFREHPITYFIEPIFAAHDKNAFEIFAYHDRNQSDPVTDRLRAHSDSWRNVHALRFAQLAEQIRRDRIDILIDLAGHTPGNRLLAFAQKPAPVQITWIAYCNTTGMSAMDYWLSDEHLNPIGGGSDALASEQIIRLSNTFACYLPPPAPAVNELPARSKNGAITFASFNSLLKLNDQVLDVWCRILRDVPKSRLLLAAQMVHDRSVQQKLADRFSARGIDPNRIDFLPHVPFDQYMALFHRVDILLDPFPFTGHTTSLHAMWMGVPMISLVGQTHVARRPLSLLSNLGLTDLLAYLPDQYVAVAKQLSGDIGRLSALRSTLRERLRASPLLDAKTFTSNLEATFRQLWNRRSD